MKNIKIILALSISIIGYSLNAQEFTGEIRAFGSDFVPRGWVECNGQELSVTTYPDLFAEIGTAFGGNGTSTFKVPNLAGAAPMGSGKSQTSGTTYELGDTGGSASIKLTDKHMPMFEHLAWQFNTSEPLLVNPPYGGGAAIGVGSAPNATVPVSGVGGGQAINNMQPSLTMVYGICTQGVPLSSITGTIGDIRLSASTKSIPRSWALCDGSLKQLSEFPKAYSIIATTYGGDGRTTFVVPDLSGRLAVGTGKMPDGSTYKINDKFGQDAVTLENNNLPPESIPYTPMKYYVLDKDGRQIKNDDGTYKTAIRKVEPGSDAILVVGNKAEYTFHSDYKQKAIDNRQPYTVINHIICMDGNFPMRIKEKDPCEDITCENGGTCVDGTCDCPDGFSGTNCENFDPSQVQALLDGGTTPKTLFDGGVSLEQLYGKTYKGGFIFYLNTIDGTGMVAATSEQDIAQWGCEGTDIIGLMNVQNSPTDPETAEGARIGDGKANTDAILAKCSYSRSAAQLCRNIGEEWFLPSRGELDLMYTNLKLNGHGGFTNTNNEYWSSTEVGKDEADKDKAWSQNFNNRDRYDAGKYFILHVRAARAF